jgi:hypothetical protein
MISPISPVTDSITEFRPRRHGPESHMQDIVAAQIPELFCPRPNSWTAASVPLGADIPDLVVVSYYPEVFALANVELTNAQILAYLRAVGKARLETIAERMGSLPSDRLPPKRFTRTGFRWIYSWILKPHSSGSWSIALKRP